MDETKIIESSELPIGEKIYLKKDWFGWRVVEPWRDPITKKINWFNFLVGGKRNLVNSIIFIIIIGLIFLAYKEQIVAYYTIMKRPCDFCPGSFASCKDLAVSINNVINLTG
jgi:hypothetical protein